MRSGTVIRFALVIASASAGTVGQATAPATAPSGPSPQAPTEPDKRTDAAKEHEQFVKRLEVVDAAMAKVEDLRADFEQRRHTPLLKKPLVSSGVVLTKGTLVRWDTAAPHASSLLVGPESIKVYYPADNLVEVYPVGEGFKDLAGAPLPRLSVLKARFDIARAAPEDPSAIKEDAKLLAVQLTPKSEELRKHVASVKVFIDESRPAATKVVMTDPDGEVTEIVFSNVQLNSGVRDDEMEQKLPPGVRVSRPLGGGTK